ncbi:hypothetical protein AcV7_002984 [Taiwanofungus camphoratus]|nr:hypothetical protein AcV7_002984 [Antrodia cinnamomea]
MPLTTSANTASNPSLPRAESSKSRSHSPNTSSVSLASAVLDTLLCILVDSSPALRVFEELKGLQLVVKILKRAGTPREVRMKCLEFLYFYLLDETIPPHRTLSEAPTSPPTSPMHTPKSSHHPKPSESMSTDTSMSSHSSSSSFPVSSTTSFSLQSTPRSSSGSSSASTPTSPTSSSQRPISALAPSPRIVTPPNTRVQPRSLLMLRKEVDYVPLSPKKAQISRLGFGGPRSGGATRAKLKQRGTVDVLSSEDTESYDVSQPARAIDAPRNRGVTVPEQSSPPIGGGKHRRAQSCADVDDVQLPSGWASPAFAMSRDESEKSSARTMEEKKEFLGSMLGNVDALVEGVRKAGIWGLG